MYNANKAEKQNFLLLMRNLISITKRNFANDSKENCNSLGRKDWSAIIIIIKILNDRIIEDRIHIFFLFNVKS